MRLILPCNPFVGAACPLRCAAFRGRICLFSKSKYWQTHGEYRHRLEGLPEGLQEELQSQGRVATRATSLWSSTTRRDTCRSWDACDDTNNNVQCTRHTEIDFRFLTLTREEDSETEEGRSDSSLRAGQAFCCGRIFYGSPRHNCRSLFSPICFLQPSILQSFDLVLVLVLVRGRFFKPFHCSALNSF